MKNKIITFLICILMTCSFAYAEEQVVEYIVPADAKIEYNRAIDNYKLGRYDDAVAGFRTAIRLFPDYIDAYYNLGALLDYLQQYDEALAIYEQVIIRSDKEYEAFYMCAKLSAKIGDKESAARYIAQIPKSNKFYVKATEIMSQYQIVPYGTFGSNPQSNISQTSGAYPNVTSPTGITSDGQGNLFVSSFSDNAIYKITPDGKKMLFYKSPNIKGPVSIASDTMGNIYVANYNANNVLKITSSGTCSVFVQDAFQPYGVHVNGNMLFVACQGTNCVLRVKIK
ncbi:tetratricopeptide repeat protein [bacterium]|nr:tetratricopeptide repeat protein [bacterium]